MRTPRVHSPPARPDGFDLRLQDEELYEDEPAVEAQALPKFADLIASSAVIDAVRDPFPPLSSCAVHLLRLNRNYGY